MTDGEVETVVRTGLQLLRHMKRTHTVTLKNCVIVILNVPCKICTNCEESFYTDEVVEKLEKIVKKAKEMVSFVNVLDYRNVA